MSDQRNERDASHAIFGGIGTPDSQPAQPSAPAAASGGSQAGQSAPPPYVVAPPSRSVGWPLIVVVVLIAAMTGVNLYMGLNAREALADNLGMVEDQFELLTRRLDTNDQLYADLKGQFQVTSDKLGLTQSELSRARRLASKIQEEQKVAVTQLNDAIETKASVEELNRLQSESAAKFGTLTTGLDDTRKDLSATQQNLEGAKGELASLIARNRDELVTLARKGDRDYYEFSLDKKGSKQKIGTVLIELRKVDAKKNRYSVRLSYDDKRTERRNRSLNEPVYFLLQGAPAALELVVNKIEKKGVVGYISAPRNFFPSSKTVLQARPA